MARVEGDPEYCRVMWPHYCHFKLRHGLLLFISKSAASVHLPFGNTYAHLDALPGEKVHGILAPWAAWWESICGIRQCDKDVQGMVLIRVIWSPKLLGSESLHSTLPFPCVTSVPITLWAGQMLGYHVDVSDGLLLTDWLQNPITCFWEVWWGLLSCRTTG